MEWLLVYPAIGVLLTPWFCYKEIKHGAAEWCHIPIMFAFTAVFWPYFCYELPKGWEQAKAEAILQKERDFEQLEKRVRREARLRHRSQIAEFDKELGIEPTWKKAYPGAAREYAFNNVEEWRDYDTRTGLQKYVKGGRV